MHCEQRERGKTAPRVALHKAWCASCVPNSVLKLAQFRPIISPRDVTSAELGVFSSPGRFGNSSSARWPFGNISPDEISDQALLAMAFRSSGQIDPGTGQAQEPTGWRSGREGGG